MKCYQKIILAVFILVVMLIGGGTEALAQETASGEDMAMSAVPVPGASPVMQDNGVTPAADTITPATGTTTTDAAAAASTPVPGTVVPNYLNPPVVVTVTPTPAPALLVTADGARPIITLDYTNYVAWLTVGPKDKYIVLEIMKAKKSKDTITYSPSTQYMYDLSELAVRPTQTTQVSRTVRIDLSFLKATSMQYIQIHGDANPLNVSGVVAINPQPKKPSIKYAGGVFTIDKKEMVPNTPQLDEYEYKTLYGSRWESLRNYNGTTSSIAGTTIQVRKKATLTTPAGVEAKVKISAAAKAPKVALDYVNGTLSIPKGVEFKLSAKGKESNVWITYGTGAAAKLTPSELLAIPNVGGILTAEEKTAVLEKEGFSIIARTKAVEKDGKVTKPASQPTFVTIPAATKVTKVEKEDKILGSVSTIYLTYRNVEKGVELTAVGGNFDYSVDQGKKWKTVKADAKKPTVVTLKADAKAVLIRESGTKEVKAKDGTITPARLPSSNSISTSWLPPLEITVSGQGFGKDSGTWSAGSNVELLYSVEQGKTQITDAVMKAAKSTLPADSKLSVSGGKITFVAPAYNTSGTNTYEIEITAEKTNYTAAVFKMTVIVTPQ